MKGNEIVERVKKEMIGTDLENEVDKIMLEIRKTKPMLNEGNGEEKFREDITELFKKFILEEDE